MTQIDVADVLVEFGKAGYGGIYLQSYEDLRALREVKKAATELDRKMFFWSLGKGLLEDGKRETDIVKDSEGDVGVLQSLTKMVANKLVVPEKSIVVLRNFHKFMGEAIHQALLVDALQQFKLSNRMLIILSPVVTLPPELEKEFTLIEMGLPDETSLGAVLDGILRASGSRIKDADKPDEEKRKRLLDAAKGLTTQEAENAFSLSLVRPKRKGKSGKDLWDPAIVLDQKCKALRKTNLFDYIEVGDNEMANIGGLDNLKEYITPLNRAFTPEAQAFGIRFPKGILLVGAPGTGKSACGKAVSSVLHMPLLKLDMGKIYSSLVGSSEANVRLAIQVAEAISPCVLWLDEIEKGVAGSGAGALDSGVSARVLGTLLTWMQEKTSPVFVYATANDVSMLPPELLRKGRFDEMFSVDLPTSKERKEILAIHLRKRNRSNLISDKKDKGLSGLIDLDHFAGETTEDFTGAEIEAAVEHSMRVAFHHGRELTSMDLQYAFDSTQPLAKTMAERLTAIRNWCRARTRPANRADAPVVVNAGAIGRGIDA